MRVAIDIGGTFTDLVALHNDGKVSIEKTLTTPQDQTIGVEKCLRTAGVHIHEAKLFLHGATVAINTVIERKGKKTALITTQGFRDVYEIGRGNRTDAYDLFFHRAKPLIPRNLRFEVEERINAQGEVLLPLVEKSVQSMIEDLRREKIMSVAICFLHSYRNDKHERRVKEMLEEALQGIFITASYEVLREFREYERTSTTVLNAYVGPIVANYLGTLEDYLKREGFHGNFLVMQSNGGAMSVETAKRTPVMMMESGPVAGVTGAARVGRELGYSSVISFDMGGTTAKTSLIEGAIPEIVSGYYIGGEASGHPSMVPVVDIIEVGSGGGSIAWIDEAGGLRVGPVSAGADPGPACFNQGGENPTVTDANFVLGRIDERYFIRGQMKLDRQKAWHSIEEKIARPLGLNVIEAALGILRIADANMSYAVRAVSVEKGKDPRDFVIVASGGGGPLHSLAIARELHIPRVIVPTLASNFSALGMLLSDLRHDYTQTYISPLTDIDQAEVISQLQMMEEEGRRTLQTEGAHANNLDFIWELDMRYAGQEYTISIPVPSRSWLNEDLIAIRRSFDNAHLEQYGHHAPDEPVDVVRLHVTAIGRISEGLALPEWPIPVQKPVPVTSRPVCFGPGDQYIECPIFLRSELSVGSVITGPAVIEDVGSTTVLSNLDRLEIHKQGHMEITIG